MCILCLQPRYTTTRGYDVTQVDHECVKGGGRQLPLPAEEAQKGGVRRAKEMEAGRHAVQRQHYAELDFADEHPIPAPPSDMFVVDYTEVGQA